MGMNPLKWLGGIEQKMIDKAIADEIAHRTSGVARQADYVGKLYKNNPDEMIRVIADRARDGSGKQIEMGAIRKDFSEMGESDFVARYSSQMKRGMGGHGSLGPRERLSHQFANNALVRRGAYPALAAGGAVAGGAAMTEGAQQLMALMGFMQQGQQQVQRTEESPLA